MQTMTTGSNECSKDGLIKSIVINCLNTGHITALIIVNNRSEQLEVLNTAHIMDEKYSSMLKINGDDAVLEFDNYSVLSVVVSNPDINKNSYKYVLDLTI